jgi:hypothetical protein
VATTVVNAAVVLVTTRRGRGGVNLRARGSSRRHTGLIVVFVLVAGLALVVVTLVVLVALGVVVPLLAGSTGN